MIKRQVVILYYLSLWALYSFEGTERRGVTLRAPGFWQHGSSENGRTQGALPPTRCRKAMIASGDSSASLRSRLSSVFFSVRDADESPDAINLVPTVGNVLEAMTQGDAPTLGSSNGRS